MPIQILTTIFRLVALPCVLAVATLGSGNAAAFSLTGISTSGDGFENTLTLKWQKRGQSYVNIGDAKKATGDLFISGGGSYSVTNLTFSLQGNFDATQALGPGSFQDGSMSIKGTVFDGATQIASGTLFTASLTAFNFDPLTPSDSTLFGYNTSITFCQAFMMCTDAESVYMLLTDGQTFDSTAITNGKPQSFAAFGVTTVPVPAAVWLFGSGLLGMVGFARRKMAK